MTGTMEQEEEYEQLVVDAVMDSGVCDRICPSEMIAGKDLRQASKTGGDYG